MRCNGQMNYLKRPVALNLSYNKENGDIFVTFAQARERKIEDENRRSLWFSTDLQNNSLWRVWDSNGAVSRFCMNGVEDDNVLVSLLDILLLFFLHFSHTKFTLFLSILVTCFVLSISLLFTRVLVSVCCLANPFIYFKLFISFFLLLFILFVSCYLLRLFCAKLTQIENKLLDFVIFLLFSSNSLSHFDRVHICFTSKVVFHCTFEM